MNLYLKYLDAGVGLEDTCNICGGEMGIHNCHTMQCQENGIDIIGREPVWEETTFSPVIRAINSNILAKDFNAADYAANLMEKYFGQVKTA